MRRIQTEADAYDYLNGDGVSGFTEQLGREHESGNMGLNESEEYELQQMLKNNPKLAAILFANCNYYSYPSLDLLLSLYISNPLSKIG